MAEILKLDDKPQAKHNTIIGKDLIKHFILIFWILFWLFNVIDKMLGGAQFLFVGKDRFAQLQRYFDAIGLSSPVITDIALIITAGLEIFAFIFFTGSFIYFKKQDIAATRSWFFMGIIFSLITFTYFSVGDQVFGDHIELLEHVLFWFITLLSWIIFIRIDTIQHFDHFIISKKQLKLSSIFSIGIAIIIIASIFWHNHNSFIERTQAVQPIKITDNLYKFKFPFLAGSKAFENSIAKFKVDNPKLSINYIYTAPPPLKLAESEGLIIYLQTEMK